MGRQRSRNLKDVAINLPQLQNLIRRDPGSYEAEFHQQLRHLESLLMIISLAPQKTPASNISELLSFVSHTLPCYYGKSMQPQTMQDETMAIKTKCSIESMPKLLLSLLEVPFTASIASDLRKAVFNAVAILRNRGVLSVEQVLPTMVGILVLQDKQLRASAYSFILHDLQKIEYSGRSQAQSLIFKRLHELGSSKLVHTQNEVSSEESQLDPLALAPQLLSICIDLYKSNTWNDAKTANAIANACFSNMNNVMMRAVHFFMSSWACEESESENETIEEEKKDKQPTKLELATLDRLKHSLKIGKKTKAAQRRLQVAIKAISKTKTKTIKRDSSNQLNSSPLHLIYNPQSFAEGIFEKAKQGGIPFDTRLVLLGLISRTIAIHKVAIPQYYSYMHRYLTPHQESATSILAYTAQAVHTDIPTEVIYAVVRVIADNFVSERASGQVISAGINTIREISSRFPYAMSSELLAELIGFKSHRDKGVVMAARSLLSVFRKLLPSLLPRKQRGKEATQKIARAKTSQPEKSSDDECEVEESDQESQIPQIDDFVDADALVTSRKRRKQTYEERIEALKARKEERSDGRQRKDRKNAGQSKSNEEKKSTKNFSMVAHSRKIQKKARLSLRDKRSKIRKHAEKMKKMRHKGR